MARSTAAVQDVTADVRNEKELAELLRSTRALNGRRLGELLIEAGALSREDLERALMVLHEHRGAHLGQVLVDNGWASQEAVTQALAKQFGIPRVRLSGFEITPEVAALIPHTLAVQHGVLPLAVHHNVLLVATATPFDEAANAALRFYTGYTIEPVLADPADIGDLQNRYYATEAESRAIAELEYTGAGGEGRSRAAVSSVEKEAQRKPIVRLVDALIMQAIHRGASDVHIRPERDRVVVYYRIDGVLQLMRTLEKRLLAPVVARIKITGNMDVAEHRLPQDGHTRVRLQGKEVDLRLSVMPTVNGESAVLRILDQQRGLKPIDELGFSDADLERLKGIISRPNGLFLVTGPTGSGKSTTLYAMLRSIRQRNPHIITVEDPVEYDMEGVEQIQVKAGIGYTFAESLRHILRHDPDVVMVGEIRDLETAAIANKAALTGHLVLSTLHTNDAASAVTRLIDMGVEPYLLASTLLGTMAQRLVRLNCPHCLDDEHAEPGVRDALGVGEAERFRHGRGCRHCDHTGFRGRTVVYELLCASPALGRLISAVPDTEAIKRCAVAEGMVPLTRQALELARRGETALAEVYALRLEGSAAASD